MEILRCWINVHETTIRQNRKIQSLIYIHNAQHSCQNKFHIGSYINNTNSLQKSSKWPWFLDKIVLGFLIHCISQQYVFKIHGHIRISGFQVRVKNNNNRGGWARREFFLVSRFHAKVVFFLFVGGHTPQTPVWLVIHISIRIFWTIHLQNKNSNF